MGDRIRHLSSDLLAARQAALLALVLLLGAYLSVATDAFLTTANLRVLMLGMAVDAVLVVGMTCVIIGGGFDLSIGAMLALSAVSFGVLQGFGLPWELAAFLALVIAVIAGTVNGVLIAWVRVNALIATLGTLYIYRGIALVIANGQTVPAGDNPIVTFFGQGVIGGVPVPVIVAAIVVIVGWVLLRWGRDARQIFFVGSNREAARLAGMRVDRIVLMSYVLMGLLAGIAALLTMGRVTSADANVATGRELRVITAVVLGGASLRGGEGSIAGSVLALLFLAILTDALILLEIPVFWQQLTVGVVLIVAVVANLWRQGLRERLAIRAALRGTPGGSGAAR
jgi:ribose transport system permease protein